MGTHDQCISQNGRKAQQNGPVSHLTNRKKRKTHTISSHRTVRRNAHRLLGQKIALRYPQAHYRRTTDPVHQELGELLFRLRRHRTQADYADTVPDVVSRAYATCRRARRVFGLLEALQG